MSFTDHATYTYHAIGSDDATRLYFENFRNYLKNHSTTSTMNVEDDARPFYYNLYGYLIFKGINSKLHWLIVMLSDIDSAEDFNALTTTLILPDISTVEELYALSDL